MRIQDVKAAQELAVSASFVEVASVVMELEVLF
jgi:hypothetical protein